MFFYITGNNLARPGWISDDKAPAFVTICWCHLGDCRLDHYSLGLSLKAVGTIDETQVAIWPAAKLNADM
jgi:hypothetical protein